jgi:hypothetical protein
MDVLQRIIYAFNQIQSGYDHSMHRSIVFGPKELGGLGIRDLFTEMMEMKINTIMAHISSNSRLGQAFRINIDLFQLTSGQTKPIFESKNPVTCINQIGYFT